MKGLRGLLEEHQNPLHAASWYIEVDVAQDVALIYRDLAVVGDSVVVDQEATCVLVAMVDSRRMVLIL